MHDEQHELLLHLDSSAAPAHAHAPTSRRRRLQARPGASCRASARPAAAARAPQHQFCAVLLGGGPADTRPASATLATASCCGPASRRAAPRTSIHLNLAGDDEWGAAGAFGPLQHFLGVRTSTTQQFAPSLNACPHSAALPGARCTRRTAIALTGTADTLQAAAPTAITAQHCRPP